MSAVKKEHSAGGVIREEAGVLLIRMRNLKGEEVWTFPKGHLEPGETPEAAALREVAEETGWECEITGPLCSAHYSFTREGVPVEKDVTWFLMRRVGGDGVPRTPDEILDMRWCPLEEAEAALTYPSDLEILDLLRRLP